jgi:hypothetical protein
MVVKPYFGLSTAPSMKSDIFVLMPFIDSLNHVYRDHISKVAENLALQIARADDFFTANTIMADIWNAICDAQLVIADCTGRNPNAFYEIGLAHTIEKQVVLITQKKTDVPFDVKHHKIYCDEYTPRGMEKFERRLSITIKALRSLY